MWSVLLVDDDPLTVAGLRDHVPWQDMGTYVVATATSGDEALALCRQYRPHIVVTDVAMPGMDGLQLMAAVQAACPGTVFVVLSGYEEFAYVRRSLQLGVVDYVLKPATLEDIRRAVAQAVDRCRQDALRRRLEGSLPALRENFLLQLLSGDPDPEEARFLGLDHLLTGPFAVALVALDRGPGMSHEEWQLARLLVRERVAGEGVYPLPPLGSELPVLLHRPADPEGWCQALLASLQGACPANVTIGLSRCCATAAEAYLQAREALAYRALLGAGRLIAHTQVEAGEGAIPPYPLDRNRRLLEALRLGNGAAVQRTLAETFAHLAQAPLAYVRALCIDLYGLGAMALSERGLPADAVVPLPRYWQRVSEARTVGELAACAAEVLGEVALRLDVGHRSRHERVLQRIEAIVAARYAEDLTLEDVAREVYLSRTYVASLIKQFRGVTFLEYLTRVRMEKARELLLTTDLAIYEIAERVGYKNPAYFARLFKEYLGVMPSEVRRGQAGGLPCASPS